MSSWVKKAKRKYYSKALQYVTAIRTDKASAEQPREFAAKPSFSEIVNDSTLRK
jgi:hypothetical protein